MLTGVESEYLDLIREPLTDITKLVMEFYSKKIFGEEFLKKLEVPVKQLYEQVFKMYPPK